MPYPALRQRPSWQPSACGGLSHTFAWPSGLSRRFLGPVLFVAAFVRRARSAAADLAKSGKGSLDGSLLLLQLPNDIGYLVHISPFGITSNSDT